MSSSGLKVTIVIPIYNEESILRAAVVDLLDRLSRFEVSYELVLVENGSTDRTREICKELRESYPRVDYFSVGQPGRGNYGKALRQGILQARGEYVFCDEIDLCDTDFYARALTILERREADFVIGSKLAEGASDERPWVRHAASIVINALLRAALDFRGTDTHGLKAFRHSVVAPIAKRCIVDKDLFASELVIRAERAGVAIREIPMWIKEKRAPSTHLLRRVPSALKNLVKLVVAIRMHA